MNLVNLCKTLALEGIKINIKQEKVNDIEVHLPSGYAVVPI